MKLKNKNNNSQSKSRQKKRLILVRRKNVAEYTADDRWEVYCRNPDYTLTLGNVFDNKKYNNYTKVLKTYPELILG